MNNNNNKEIPPIGFGSSGCKHTEDVTYHSIKDGNRLIDTASFYKNEEEVGKGITRAINEGLVKREDLFIITKCWINERQDPVSSLRSSLERLKLSYVDLYLDHWPSLYSYGENSEYPRKNMVPMHKVWEGLERCVELGLSKNIGVSNYNVQSLCNLLSFCKIKPMVNEVEFHPYFYQRHLKEFCEKENIKIISYYPLVKGRDSGRGPDLFKEEIIQTLAKKYGKTEGQIILAWHIQMGVIPIPGTSKVDRMKENLGATSVSLSEEELDNISKLNKMLRISLSFKFGAGDIFA